MAYKHVPTEDYPDFEGIESESKRTPRNTTEQYSFFPELSWVLVGKSLATFNIFMLIVVLFKQYVFQPEVYCAPGPAPPWSPLREAGAIRYVNKEYKSEKVFQSETSEEVEAAWNAWEDEFDHLLILPKSQTEDRLPITVDAFLDPGNAVYGLAVYHQYHCLNHIRKSFYGDRFFKEQDQTKVQFHKNHCFDMLPQSILCNADIAIMHWWNDTYSYVDSTGTLRLTDHYLSLTPSMQAEGAFAKWDGPVQCRDLDSINAWANLNAMDDEKYIATLGIPKRSKRGL